MITKDTRSISTEKKPTVQYVDPVKFYEALVAYKADCALFPVDEPPRVPEYIGECILKIAQNLARRPNFANYSWRNDMIGDAIETSLKYVKSFDPTRSKSAFGYFSQICWFAFIGRIQTEKKQGKIKREMVRYANFDTFALQEADMDGEYVTQMNEFLLSLGDEPAHVTPVKKAPKGKLEAFFDGAE